MAPFPYPWNEAAHWCAREQRERRAAEISQKAQTGPPIENVSPGRCSRSAGAQKQIDQLIRKSNFEGNGSNKNNQAAAGRGSRLSEAPA
jgi:hypothetical protein